MRIRIVSYTEQGQKTARRIADAFAGAGHTCESYAPARFCKEADIPLAGSAAGWAREGFSKDDALVFCCAAGIAVRAVAPWVRDKTADPAVLAVDEAAEFAIPLLSGHLGGANDLARELSQTLGCIPVITTATDLRGLFAVDVFAAKNHLWISSMERCKEISAALLKGEPVGFISDLPVAGERPVCLTDKDARIGIYVTRNAEREPFLHTLRLIPKRYALGVGCRRGKPFQELKTFLEETLKRQDVLPQEIRCVASIDLKRDEPGLLEFCDSLSVPLVTFPAEKLRETPGIFSASDFVERQTGVDCVSERAAVTVSNGKLVMKKTAADGMTAALAEYEEEIRFV